jgi:hypothetical protein
MTEEMKTIHQEWRPYDEAVQTIYDVSKELNFLGRAFYATGNEKVGENLCSLSTTLNICIENIQKHTNEQTYQRYKASEESSINMINAVLAVVTKN